MKFLKEDRGNYVEFDQSDLDFVNSLVAPFATASFDDETTTIRVYPNKNKYCGVGCLNMSQAFDNAVTAHILEKHKGVSVQFNNDATIFWAYKRNID